MEKLTSQIQNTGISYKYTRFSGKRMKSKSNLKKTIFTLKLREN